MSMKAIILHGTDCKPEDYWYQWLGKQLEARGYTVEIPYYPDINHEPIDVFLPKVLGAHTFDNETVLIGHSAGAPLILSILENVEATLPQAILVAGYARIRPEDDGKQDPVIQDGYDWERIKAHAQDFVFINSTNDPWGCNDVEGRFMYDQLGGTQVIRKEGHFGSASFNQPYKEFPLLERLVK
jgi:predicted alpha/beta hydrolase family esterase